MVKGKNGSRSMIKKERGAAKEINDNRERDAG